MYLSPVTSSLNINTKVTGWLEALPEPLSPSCHKRRRALVEMDVNTPTKRSRRDDDGKGDSDATPRNRWNAPGILPPGTLPPGTNLEGALSAPRAFQWVMPTSGPSSVDSESTAGTASNSAASSDLSGKSSKRKREDRILPRREPSPTKGAKGLAQLQRARYPVLPECFSRWEELPPPLRELGRDLGEISAGRGIVPRARADELVPWLREHPTDDQYLTSHTRQSLGASPQRDFVDEIVSFARENRKVHRSEAAWNGNNHQPIIFMAWRLSVHAARQRYENVTTAAIEPTALLAAAGAPRAPKAASKKVDFALTLILDNEARTVQHPTECQVDGLGQSRYEPLRWSPITTSFETKPAGEGLANANFQLGTWALAQVAKLRFLLVQAGNPDAEIPPLPLVLIQGSEWRFSIFEAGATEATQWAYSGVLGDTTGARGVFQVVSALHCLMDWGERVYRPWFLDMIVKPILGTRPYHSGT